MPRVIPPNIAQYCCAEYDGRVSLFSLDPNQNRNLEMRLADLVTCIEQTPLFAAAVCTKMTPFVAISYFLRDNPSLDGIPLNKWLAP